MFDLNGRTRTIAVALALCAGFVALPAAAQPMHRAGGGDQLIHAIAAFKAQLNLNTSQQAMWDAAVAAGKTARDAAVQRRQAVKATAEAELAKTTPNLAAIAQAVDQAQDANTAARRQVRQQWLALYGTFTPDQVAVVKAGMAKRLARIEMFRERMLQRFGKN
jgi:uncharacterized membrane protein